MAFITRYKIELTDRLENALALALSWGQLDNDESDYPFLKGGSEPFYSLLSEDAPLSQLGP